jgi:hypothetical protein
VLSNTKRLAALVLRGVANRLDPEPPYQAGSPQVARMALERNTLGLRWIPGSDVHTNVIANTRGEG